MIFIYFVLGADTLNSYGRSDNHSQYFSLSFFTK